jgi:hypothetical protein
MPAQPKKRVGDASLAELALNIILQVEAVENVVLAIPAGLVPTVVSVVDDGALPLLALVPVSMSGAGYSTANHRGRASYFPRCMPSCMHEDISVSLRMGVW